MHPSGQGLGSRGSTQQEQPVARQSTSRRGCGFHGAALVECALHLRADLETLKVKAGPQPGDLLLHPIAAGHPSPDLVQRLYSTVLAPLCSGLVFLEAEFGGVSAIIHLLATWVRNCVGQPPLYRPRILVVRAKETARLPGDLDIRMTAAILATCNPTRELTTKAAQSLWRSCFGDISSVVLPDGDENMVYRRAIGLSEQAPLACPALPGLARVLRAACVHFADSPGTVFNVIRASRIFPLPPELPSQLQALFGLVEDEGNNALLRPASLLVAAKSMRG